VEPLLDKGFPILGVHVNNYVFKKIETGKEIFRRVMQLTVRQSVLRNKPLCDIFIEPLLEKEYALFDLKVAGELYEIGYRAAEEALQ
jgi:NTE family protein